MADRIDLLIQGDAYFVRRMTKDDLRQLATLHRITFSRSLGESLGPQYLRAFFTWFVSHPECINLVCEGDRKLIGYVFGAPCGYSATLNRSLLPWIVMAILRHPLVILHRHFLAQLPSRVGSLLGLSSRHSRDQEQNRMKLAADYVLVGIGVDPDHRGLGAGRHLLTAFEQEVWQEGHESIRLTVYRTNTVAQALYSSQGWTLDAATGETSAYVKRKQVINV